MAVIIRKQEFVDYTGLGAIIIFTEAGQFGEHVLATFATVLYLHPVRLFLKLQLRQGLLAIVVITSVA